MSTRDVSTGMRISYDTKAEAIKKWLSKVPDDAKISVLHTAGDRPWESGEDRIKASWTEELGD